MSCGLLYCELDIHSFLFRNFHSVAFSSHNTEVTLSIKPLRFPASFSPCCLLVFVQTSFSFVFLPFNHSADLDTLLLTDHTSLLLCTCVVVDHHRYNSSVFSHCHLIYPPRLHTIALVVFLPRPTDRFIISFYPDITLIGG